MKLDKESVIPLYYQLADFLREDIRNSVLKSGDIVPSENELIKLHNISRGTVREAMRLLLREGIIKRHRGIGTFVTPSKVEHETSEVTSFSRVMLMSGKRPSARVLLTEIIPAPGYIAQALQLENDKRVVLIKRLRYGDSEPFLIEHSYYRHDVGKLLLNEKLEESLYKILQDKYNFQLVRSEKVLEVTSADREDADMLQIKMGSPIIILKRKVFDHFNKPIEYAEDIYRSDRTKFKIKSNSPISTTTTESFNV